MVAAASGRSNPGASADLLSRWSSTIGFRGPGPALRRARTSACSAGFTTTSQRGGPSATSGWISSREVGPSSDWPRLKSGTGRRLVVSVVVPDPVLRVVQALLVAPLGDQVEEVVRAVEHVDSTCVARVGLEDGAGRVLVEHARSLAVRRPGIGPGEIVQGRSAPELVRRERCLEVVVEVAGRRGNPLEAPSHPFLECLDLLQRVPAD